VTVTVGNSGEDCIEVVQLYASFPSSSVVRPDVQLVGFARIHVPAGQRRTVRFTLEAARLAATGADGRLAVDPGVVVLSAGPSAADRPVEARVRLSGDRRILLARAGRTAWAEDGTEGTPAQ
jgi:hypothetical protein